MTQKHESLSALVDGEVKDEALLTALTQDKALADKWQRYHLIRQGLRKELPANGDFDITARVAEALADEPDIVAPKRTWRSLPVVASVIPFVRQGSQLAIAASVAVAVVLGVQQMNQPPEDIPLNGTPATLPGIQGGISPVSLEQTRSVPRSDVMEQRRIMNAFMTDHRHQLRIKSDSATDEQADTDKTAVEKTPAQGEKSN